MRTLPIAVIVDGHFFPQRTDLGLDPRESTPGFKRQIVIANAHASSFKRASQLIEHLVGQKVSTNTIERICLDVGEELEAAEQQKWKSVINGEVPIPSLAIVEFDGGRIRTRQTDCGPGVHLESTGWNETKNAIFVSANSEPSEVDPQPEPPACFLDREHMAELAESTKLPENKEEIAPCEAVSQPPDDDSTTSKSRPSHKPQRILRTVLSSMSSSKEFGPQMAREAERRRFDEASRKAFVSDGLPCNWAIHAVQFRSYVPILDFVHAVTHLFSAAVACFGKTDEAWSAYIGWMRQVWQGEVDAVIVELEQHQQRLGHPPVDASDDDPREQLRQEIGYFKNNRDRMKYDQYRREGLPTTSAWMESAVKEVNYRVKGTEKFWNNPTGAEAILRIRAATLCDDDRLVRFLTNRPGRSTLRRPVNQAA